MGTSVSSAFLARIRNFAVACATFALTLGLAPATSLAADVPMLASSLLDGSTAIVSEDVELVAVDDDGVDAVIEPIIGSFTVDGLTFAVNADDGITLVAVSSDVILSAAAESGEVEGSLSIPPSITYDGVTYDVMTIGPYAFYLSGATQIALPASIVSVDDRAFRSSDVERVEVASGNPNIASFDGCLYDSQLLSLLLIPEGRAGAVLLPETAEEVQASKFSHCSLVDAISVEEGGAAFASWEGLLYDASGQTLLRVPAGAVDITIREGCTTIAAGAMEGCAKLERINAPASVTSISPDVFIHKMYFATLPVQSVADRVDRVNDSQPKQLNALVAFSGDSDSVSFVNPARIVVVLPFDTESALWAQIGFDVKTESEELGSASDASLLDTASSYAANTIYAYAYPSDLRCRWGNRTGVVTDPQISGTPWRFYSWNNLNIPNVKSNSTYGYYINWSADNNTMWLTNTSGSTVHVSSYTSTRPANLPAAKAPANQLVILYNNYQFTVTWNASTNGGKVLNNTGAYADSYSQKVAITANTTAYPSVQDRPGYEFLGWASSASETNAAKCVKPGASNLTVLNSATYYGIWKANPYTIVFDSQGGTAHSSISATYDKDATLPEPSRPGYIFQGWDTKTDGTGERYNAGALTKPNIATSGEVTLYAQWGLVVSATMPLEVTAKVDLLGIDEQQVGQGHIESLCGEALKVTDVGLEPLAGASILFGSDANRVSLEAYADQDASPFASFDLHVAGSESNPTALSPLYMAAYGDRVPIRYRFVIPDDLLPTLTETTLPVCQVSYTVALA